MLNPSGLTSPSRAQCLAPDTALMARVAVGDGEAFAILVERHSPALYRVGCRMLNDQHEAEDIVQECFARLWQKAPVWQPSGSGLVGWLYRIAVNLCFERHRRLRLVGVDEDREYVDDAPLPDAMLETTQTRDALAAALAELPERHRAALVLCYTEGLTNALAAEVMELKLKAMESLLVRARRQLRERLAAYSQPASDQLADATGCAA